MEKDIKKLISQMTLEEKAAMLSGSDSWHTAAVDRLGIPSVMMADGPHGLRRETGVRGESYPATCFPTGSALACSWDRALITRLGSALADECRSQGISIILGPAVNIKRSPLCGRNFEYYSEDPYLSSQTASAYIKGVQSKGVGTSLKHFAANNKETDRMTTDTVVDERTLREIYFASFETAVKEAKPWTVMCAYNKLNGEFCSENRYLLTDILRKEWGFEGMVVSDWGAVNERDDGVLAGLDLEMPTSFGVNTQKIIDAVKSGKIPAEALDRAVGHVLSLVLKCIEAKKSFPHTKTFTDSEHHALAREIASQCMVLLKNDGTLPLKKTGRLAVIGQFAKKPRYQGGGSSHIHPTMLDIPLDEIKKSAPGLTVLYSDGYDLSDETGAPDPALIDEAVKTAESADAAVIFAGLPDSFESEGYDRRHMKMPDSHNALIEAVSNVQKNTVVVLFNGSPVEMPWIGSVSAVLEGYLCGQASGGAAADILFGDVNPSGKLAETFPKKLSDNPSYLNFPGEKPNYVEYREGIFVGYRYYEKKQIAPLFPFGHGLSYTTFEYRGIKTDKTEIGDGDTLTVQVTVANTGKRAGKETVQLYVRDVESSIMRPFKELRGFEKVELEPGEEKTVSFTLSKRDFAYYDTELNSFEVESGTFEILAGGSSADTPLCQTVVYHSGAVRKPKYNKLTQIGEIAKNPAATALLQEFLAKFGLNIDIKALSQWIYEMPLRNIYLTGINIPQEEFDNLIKKLNRL
ncbi:glycoside hydrolase family 3 C-terminal domain-containing protein [[Clostridium] cellulosi]